MAVRRSRRIGSSNSIGNICIFGGTVMIIGAGSELDVDNSDVMPRLCRGNHKICLVTFEGGSVAIGATDITRWNLERFWLGGAAHKRRDERTVCRHRAGERKTSWTKANGWMLSAGGAHVTKGDFGLVIGSANCGDFRFRAGRCWRWQQGR